MLLDAIPKGGRARKIIAIHQRPNRLEEFQLEEEARNESQSRSLQSKPKRPNEETKEEKGPYQGPRTNYIRPEGQKPDFRINDYL